MKTSGTVVLEATMTRMTENIEAKTRMEWSTEEVTMVKLHALVVAAESLHRHVKYAPFLSFF